MEMHCVRYFLALAETLDFTRAAERCCVGQASISRAIKKLEKELDGDLFHRQHARINLTELGLSMFPLLKQCYASATAAQTLAEGHRRGENTCLRLAVSHTVQMELLVDHLKELGRVAPKMEFVYRRGTAAEIVELLKSGEVELAIAGSLGSYAWNRLDSWPLFEEEFVLGVSDGHRYAKKDRICLSQLSSLRMIARPYCEYSSQMKDLLSDIEFSKARKAKHDEDLIPLIKLDIGVGIIPKSLALIHGLQTVGMDNIDIKRHLNLYSVAGRKRTVAGAALIGLLGSADWNESLKRIAFDLNQ